MYEKRLSGVVIPMITPMREDEGIDTDSLEKMTEFLCGTKVDALYPNGTNGESLLMSEEERKQIAQTIAEVNDHRLPLFIQCGAISTAQTAALAQHAVEIGADGAGIMSPAFFPMDEESLYLFYRDVLTGLPEDFPVYVYNIPGCTTSDVKPALLHRLMGEFPNIAGIKYSSPDLMRIQDYLNTDARKPDVLIGCDSLFLQCLMTGGVGTVTGPGAIFHERFTGLYEKYRAGDYEGAAAVQARIAADDRRMAGIPGIPGLKALLKLRGVIANDTCRRPLRALGGEEHALLEEVYGRYQKEEMQ